MPVLEVKLLVFRMLTVLLESWKLKRHLTKGRMDYKKGNWQMEEVGSVDVSPRLSEYALMISVNFVKIGSRSKHARGSGP